MKIYSKLVNTETHEIYAEFSEESSPYFHDKDLAIEFSRFGIAIPQDYRNEFDGKKIIYIEDEEFARAFKEIFYEYHLNHRKFQWE